MSNSEQAVAARRAERPAKAEGRDRRRPAPPTHPLHRCYRARGREALALSSPPRYSGARGSSCSTQRRPSSRGRGTTIIAQWKDKLELGSKVNPIYGRSHPTEAGQHPMEDGRGMVPKTKAKGTLGLEEAPRLHRRPREILRGHDGQVRRSDGDQAAPHVHDHRELAHNIGWNG